MVPKSGCPMPPPGTAAGYPYSPPVTPQYIPARDRTLVPYDIFGETTFGNAVVGTAKSQLS